MIGIDKVIAPLFVPGDRPERFEKAAASGADAVIFDLEDAVAASAKDAARANVLAAASARPAIVRINATGTAWHEEDVATVLEGGFSGLMVPKAEADLGFAALARRAATAGVAVIALVETARGHAGAREIAAVEGVARLAFGSFDYCADLGCAHTRDALLNARCELVLASRLAGLPAPWDGVTASVSDIDAISEDARYARTLGLGGKLCIHPAQIQPVKVGFRPDEAEIAWAHKVLASGDGAAAVDGVMVDEPVRKRAQRILQIAAG